MKYEKTVRYVIKHITGKYIRKITAAGNKCHRLVNMLSEAHWFRRRCDAAQSIPSRAKTNYEILKIKVKVKLDE